MNSFPDRDFGLPSNQNWICQCLSLLPHLAVFTNFDVMATLLGEKGLLGGQSFPTLNFLSECHCSADSYWCVYYNLLETVMRSTAPFTEVAACQWGGVRLAQSDSYQTVIKTERMEVCTLLLLCWAPQHWSASRCFCLFNYLCCISAGNESFSMDKPCFSLFCFLKYSFCI